MADINAAAKFLEKGQKLIAAHPDFNDKLQEADSYGLTISAPAVAEIVRLGCPEVAYWLAKDENIEGAMRLMNMDCDQQIVEVKRLAKQLEASGFANDPDTDEYLKNQSPNMAKREGRRR